MNQRQYPKNRHMHYHFSSYEEQKDPRIILFCKNIISTLKDVSVFNIACDIKNFIRDSQYDEKNTSTTNDKFVWYYTLESYPDVYLSYQHYIVSDNWEVYTENIVFDKEKNLIIPHVHYTKFLLISSLSQLNISLKKI